MAIIFVTITNDAQNNWIWKRKTEYEKVDLSEMEVQNVSLGIEQLNIIKKNEKPNPIPNFNTFLHKL